MHVRASSIAGMPVLDDQTQEVVGFLRDPLIHPDTGRVEGFFVVPSFPLAEGDELFLSGVDIIGWGTKVHVRSGDRLSPPHELIRLQPLLHEHRQFLGQAIITRGSKRKLGTCADVQFDTRHFMVEWLFPRKYLFLRQPLPATDILEVTSRAIWMRDPLKPARDDVIERKKEAVVLSDVLPVAQGPCEG
jgi:uncharacterized protein YrrD